MRRNLPADSSVQDVRFLSRDKGGYEREILATVMWKRFDNGLSRVIARVEAPVDLRGSALLVIEKEAGPMEVKADLFMYLPELRKVRRITTHTLSGNLFGSDFTYEDFQNLQGMAMKGETERLPDAELEGVPVWVLSHRPGTGSGSSYARVVSYVERERCVPLKVEMWELGERLRKVLTTDRDKIFEEKGVRMPSLLVLEDLKRGSSTRLELLKIDLKRRVKRFEFSPTALER